METRTGSGYDVHKFNDEKTGPIMICGIAIPSPKDCWPIQMGMLACTRYVMRYLAHWGQAILVIFSRPLRQNGKRLHRISF